MTPQLAPDWPCWPIPVSSAGASEFLAEVEAGSDASSMDVFPPNPAPGLTLFLACSGFTPLGREEWARQFIGRLPGLPVSEIGGNKSPDADSGARASEPACHSSDWGRAKARPRFLRQGYLEELSDRPLKIVVKPWPEAT